jgi:hypothetical protein
LIARDYDISPRTIEVYRANVMTKMQAGSLSELVRLAMRAGVLKDRAKSSHLRPNALLLIPCMNATTPIRVMIPDGFVHRNTCCLRC